MARVMIFVNVPTENYENILFQNSIKHKKLSASVSDLHEFDSVNSIFGNNQNLKRNCKSFSEDLDKKGNISLYKILSQVLLNMKVMNVAKYEDEKHIKVFFDIEGGKPCDDLLKILTECGIGTKFNSSIIVTPTCIYYQSSKIMSSPHQQIRQTETSFTTKANVYDNGEISAWEKFSQSVKARLIVAQVVETVKKNSSLTFDFLLLLLIAALTSALGLLTTNATIQVASMLISPLMGPVVAGMLGTAIKNKQLQKIGILNELLGLILCILVGFIFGLILSFSGNILEITDWPKEFMYQKSNMNTLWLEVIISLLSGFGVSIAILSNNTESLIGVAISVSLLPPAVNSGLLWSLSIYNIFNEVAFKPDYKFVWSDVPSKEFAMLGSISLCVTFINIICIFIAGMIVLKVKDVAPRDIDQIWNVIKLARDYKKINPDDNANNNLTPDSLENDINANSPKLNFTHMTWPSPGCLLFPKQRNFKATQKLHSIFHTIKATTERRNIQELHELWKTSQTSPIVVNQTNTKIIVTTPTASTSTVLQTNEENGTKTKLRFTVIPSQV